MSGTDAQSKCIWIFLHLQLILSGFKYYYYWISQSTRYRIRCGIIIFRSGDLADLKHPCSLDECGRRQKQSFSIRIH